MNKITPATLACTAALALFAGSPAQGQQPEQAPPAAGAPAAPAAAAPTVPPPAAAPAEAPTAPVAAAPVPAEQPAAEAPAQPAQAAPEAPAQPTPAAEAPAQPAQAAPPAHDEATAPLPPFEGAAGEHGAAPHAAAEGGHHAGGHEGPLIENWWSWDYGPGKPYHNPPFGFALINFAVFLLILGRLFGKSFRDFLRTRHGDVRRAIDRAQEAQQQAEKHLAQIEERSRHLEAEISEVMASYRRLAEAERKTIVQRAEAEAESLLRDAEAQAQAAIAAARWQLEQKTALMAVDLAEKLVRGQLSGADQQRIDEKAVADIEALARHPQRGASGTPAGKERL